MNDIVDSYLATWNATGAQRRALLDQYWAGDVTYADPLAEVSGREGVAALIEGAREQFPGFVFAQVGAVDAHHRQARFQWGLGPEGQAPVVIGFDVLVVDDSGQIADVRGFLDKVPS